MSNKTVTKIPLPQYILSGDWDGMVYAVDTESDSKEQHDIAVQETIENLVEEFSKNHHDSVSLRFVKSQLVFMDTRIPRHCTLVQFRVRDSY